MSGWGNYFFNIERDLVKSKVRDAMYLELTEYWKSGGDSYNEENTSRMEVSQIIVRHEYERYTCYDD